MRFVLGRNSRPKSISRSDEIPGRSLGKTSGNSLATRTDSMEGFSESKSLTLIIWYAHPFEIILQALRQEMIGPVGIEFPPFHYKTSSLGTLNFKIPGLQSMEAKKSCNQYIPKMTSKYTISC